jgi:drug/metabolite transporter (DMT)-like permease
MRHYLSIIVAAIIFGSSGVFVKTVQLPVTTLAFLRMVVPFALMSLIFLLRKKPFPNFNDKFMILGSFLNAMRMLFFFAGYAYGNISTTVILLYTWPVFATLWSCLFLGEKISRERVGLFATTFAGVALIVMNQTLSLSNQRFTGLVFILLTSIIYSMTIVIFKKKSLNYDPFEILWFQNGIGTFVFFPFLMMNRPFPELWQFGLASGYGCLVGVVGFGLFFSGLRKIEASKASFLTYIEVVSGIFFGVVFFNEQLTWNIIAGGSLVLVSALTLSRQT